MSNRRKLRGAAKAPRPSPLKGRAMTPTPSAGTVRRWLRAAEAEGAVRRAGVSRDGSPGRPAQMWELTEEGRERARELPPLGIALEKLCRQENARKKRARQRAAAQPGPEDESR